VTIPPVGPVSAKVKQSCSKSWNEAKFAGSANVTKCLHKLTETSEGVSKSFRTGHLEREMQMIQLSATRCCCIAILSVSLVSFAATTLYVASQQVFIVVVYFVMTQSGDFWIHSLLSWSADLIYLSSLFTLFYLSPPYDPVSNESSTQH
jgi:hypothetical protein